MNLIVRDISNILLKGAWNTTMLLLLYVSTLLTACNEDSDNEDNPPYPSLITEFVDIPTDEYGCAHTIVNDDHTIFQLSNPIDGLQVSATYRAVCGYEITDWDKRIITLYTIEAVDILKAKDTPKCDAVKVTAIWKGGDYLNMNLTPKTQGGKQEWGYHIDNITNKQGYSIYYISLFHDQKDDLPSYSDTHYACVYLPHLTDIQPSDSVYLTITTPDGNKTWGFAY